MTRLRLLSRRRQKVPLIRHGRASLLTSTYPTSDCLLIIYISATSTRGVLTACTVRWPDSHDTRQVSSTSLISIPNRTKFWNCQLISPSNSHSSIWSTIKYRAIASYLSHSHHLPQYLRIFLNRPPPVSSAVEPETDPAHSLQQILLIRQSSVPIFTFHWSDVQFYNTAYSHLSAKCFTKGRWRTHPLQIQTRIGAILSANEVQVMPVPMRAHLQIWLRVP